MYLPALKAWMRLNEFAMDCCFLKSWTLINKEIKKNIDFQIKDNFKNRKKHVDMITKLKIKKRLHKFVHRKPNKDTIWKSVRQNVITTN